MREADEPAALVHGLAGDRVEPDWPPLTGEEARWVAERRGLTGRGRSREDARVLWCSPRPLRRGPSERRRRGGPRGGPDG